LQWAPTRSARHRRGRCRLRPRRHEQGTGGRARAQSADLVPSGSRRATPTAPCSGRRWPSG
jgi:hypothetical protein